MDYFIHILPKAIVFSVALLLMEAFKNFTKDLK